MKKNLYIDTVFIDLIIAVFSSIVLYWIVNLINKKLK